MNPAPAATGPAAPVARRLEGAPFATEIRTQVAADVVAQQVTATYAGSMPVDVVQGGRGSTIVQPDRWAVALQTELPDYADHMWVVVPRPRVPPARFRRVRPVRRLQRRRAHR